MEAVSRVNSGTRIPVALPVSPWWSDHRFNGKAILPAVEAMALLAQKTREAFPHCNIRKMGQCAFRKFLEIPPGHDTIDVVVEVEQDDVQRVTARLLSRMQLNAMARMTLHCQLTFPGETSPASNSSLDITPSAAAACRAIDAEQIYRELVPFGPAYQTLCGQLILETVSAKGMLCPPDLPRNDSLVGSPFVLDGAMHAACVHGQRLVDFIPFPVGFASRTIQHLTQAGGRYLTVASLCSMAADELIYDLCICGQEGQVFETVAGLRMRDVSGGRIRPPAWIRSTEAV